MLSQTGHGHKIISSKNPFMVASTSGDLVTWVLQILLGLPCPASTGTTEKVFVANGIQTIPKELLLRIRWGEYIRLAKLPAVKTAKNSTYLVWCPEPSQKICARINTCAREGEKGRHGCFMRANGGCS